MKTLKFMAVAMMGVGVLSSCSNKDKQLSRDLKLKASPLIHLSKLTKS